MCGDTFVYTYICTACACAREAVRARCVGARRGLSLQSWIRNHSVTAVPAPWDTTSYHRDLPCHWTCAQSSSSRQAQVSLPKLRAVSGLRAGLEVLHRVHREHSGNGSSFFSIFLVRIEEVRRTSLKRGGERKKGGRLQMVRFKNRYFVVEVIWDEAFEVC